MISLKELFISSSNIHKQNHPEQPFCYNDLELSKTYSFSSSKVKESLPESFPREYCELNLNPSLRRSESRECRLLLVPLWLQFPEK